MSKVSKYADAFSRAAAQLSGITLLLFSLLASGAAVAQAATPWYAEGNSHTLALMKDGTVWAVGGNGYGQLGNGDTSWWRPSSEPKQVPGLSHVIAVAAGGAHSAALKEDGTVWAWGYNSAGQLGNSRMEFSSVPVQVAGLREIKAIASGNAHLVALQKDGTIWAWGSNRVGQLGNESAREISPTPVKVGQLHDVTSIAAGGYHTVALQQDGTVWTWGYNSHGAQGNGIAAATITAVPTRVSQLSDVTAIAAGIFHSVALKGDGTAWIWGSNVSGQQGNGLTSGDNAVPVQVAGVRGATDVIAKANHTVALMQDGSAMAWGDQGSGRWGNGFSVDGSSTPVQMKGASGVTSVAALVNPSTLRQPGDSMVARAEHAGVVVASIDAR